MRTLQSCAAPALPQHRRVAAIASALSTVDEKISVCGELQALQKRGRSVRAGLHCRGTQAAGAFDVCTVLCRVSLRTRVQPPGACTAQAASEDSRWRLVVTSVLVTRYGRSAP